MSTTAKETYKKLREKFSDLPEWKTLIYYAGIPKKEDIEDVYHIVNIFRGSVSGLMNNFMAILTPNNFTAVQDKKICKDRKDKILKATLKCGYILRQSMTDLMNAALEKDYENKMAGVAKWISEEAMPELKFFHENTRFLAEKWKELKIESNEHNHFSH